MKISNEQIQKLISAYKPYMCPLCHNNNWMIGDTIFYLNEYNKIAFEKQAQLPVFPITCDKCGNTLFVNAIMANILDIKQSNDQNG